MVEYCKVNFKLPDSQINKLKSAVKNRQGLTLRMNIKMVNWNNLPHDLLLTRQKKNKVEKCIWKQYINWCKGV